MPLGKLRACKTRLMNVQEAKEVCIDRTRMCGGICGYCLPRYRCSNVLSDICMTNTNIFAREVYVYYIPTL